MKFQMELYLSMKPAKKMNLDSYNLEILSEGSEIIDREEMD